MSDADEEKYEYTETTGAIDQGDHQAPNGDGWEFVEEYSVGRTRVYRWRRLREAARPSG